MDRVSGRGARRGRGLPLSLVILRYFAYVLAAAVALAVGTYVVFGILVGTGTVYPANYGDTALAETSARLAELPTDDAEAVDAAVPSSFRWALFAKDGAYVAGDAPESARDDLKAAAFDGLAIAYGGLSTTRYEPVELADGSVCVLTYDYMPQFASKGLRDALPNPQNLLLGGFAVLAVLVLVGIAVRAARVLSRKMAPLADAARRIEERDLDFEVGTSGVREIDDVLGAMDEMRASLKDSLEAQWRSEQAQREQIAALAHDLKTPLTVVRGNVDLLLEGELTDDQRPCAADAAEGARQMGTYLAALIDATLGDATAFAPVERPLRPLLARLRAQAEALAACGGAQVAWSEGAGLPETLRMDEALVERAVMNVVANAVEHAPADSTVEVRVRADGAADVGGALAVSVADAGPGFSPEALERGCERFYQGDPARAARGHRGLGLHVAAGAAARHGGSVELANRDAAEGRGARVTLRLPRG
ncbi:HAMP domain-containing histidine kinase [Eggerthella guodeyinii]|uniref:Signal transduction histidine-protein kinase/phosphatase MprB n=1 Tax=Eggerthella guodeyinii TaxID=2690837 RepID=A0A6L7IVC6_9ACTN|nr:HAMP domain-containing sensor histidine kinase [Eggerthella guodeyinii]QOS69394.1 HAMP domain-containing histidine kinase [Eggerthella guodeyinii]